MQRYILFGLIFFLLAGRGYADHELNEIDVPGNNGAANPELRTFCENPVQAICGDKKEEIETRSKNLAEQDKAREAEMAKILERSAAAAYPNVPDEKRTFDLNNAGDVAAFETYLTGVYDRATALAPTAASLVDKARENLQHVLKQHPAGPPGKVVLDPSRAAIAGRISKVNVITSAKGIRDEIAFIRTNLNPVEVTAYIKEFLSDIQNYCGKNLEEEDAAHTEYFYRTQPGTPELSREYVILCPAELFWSSDGPGKPREGFAVNALSHEIAHVAGSDDYPAVYAALFQCLTDLKNQYGRRDEILDPGEKPKPAPERDRAKEIEIGADYWTGEAMAPWLTTVGNGPGQIKFLRDALEQYCSYVGDANTPNGKFRIQLMGYNPRLRAALACNEIKPAGGLACGLEGKVNI